MSSVSLDFLACFDDAERCASVAAGFALAQSGDWSAANERFAERGVRCLFRFESEWRFERVIARDRVLAASIVALPSAGDHQTFFRDLARLGADLLMVDVVDDQAGERLRFARVEGQAVRWSQVVRLVEALFPEGLDLVPEA